MVAGFGWGTTGTRETRGQIAKKSLILAGISPARKFRETPVPGS
jgi:hypothetical protein